MGHWDGPTKKRQFLAKAHGLTGPLYLWHNLWVLLVHLFLVYLKTSIADFTSRNIPCLPDFTQIFAPSYCRRRDFAIFIVLGIMGLDLVMSTVCELETGPVE